jgi:hypothetical protein
VREGLFDGVTLTDQPHLRDPLIFDPNAPRRFLQLAQQFVCGHRMQASSLQIAKELFF